jgi:flagellar hook-basal body complex protein FliE
MTVTLAAGAAAYAQTARNLATPAAPVKGTGTGFGDLVQSALQGAVDSQRQGEAASLAAVTGKADLNGVVAAVTNAELTLQTVVAIRDRVVQAYQDILHLAI